MSDDRAFEALCDRILAYEEAHRGSLGALREAMEDGAIFDADLEAAIIRARADRDDEAESLIYHLMTFPPERRRWFADWHQFLEGKRH